MQTKIAIECSICKQYRFITKEAARRIEIGRNRNVCYRCANKGKVHTEEHKKTRSWKGKKHKPETIKKMKLVATGRKLTEETKKKISVAKTGKKGLCKEKNPAWKGGVTKENELLRKSLQYRLWRTAVFERDNYTCVWCGAKSKSGKAVHLQADHIKPFCDYPEIRFAIDNGRTLCLTCHKTTETYGRNKKK